MNQGLKSQDRQFKKNSHTQYRLCWK